MKTRGATLLLTVLAIIGTIISVNGQRIQTVEIQQNRYFISNASPYAPTLNWFLAYEYCRNIGMELVSFGQKEETEYLNSFLLQNGYHATDYWTSGNQLGSAMWIWMSTGQPFNSTFNEWSDGFAPLVKSENSCMSTHRGIWMVNNCMDNKAFMCEQTRCFYYNYVVTNRAESQGNTTNTTGIQNPTNSRPVILRRTTQQSLIQTSSIRPEVTETTPFNVPTSLPSELSQTIIDVTPTSTVPASSPQQNEIQSASQQIPLENIQQTLQPPSRSLDQAHPALARLLQRKETFSWALQN